MYMCHFHFTVFLFSNVSDFIQRWHSYVKVFSTVSEIRPVFWIYLQLHVLCTKAVKLHYDKITIYRSRATINRSLWKQETSQWLVPIIGPQSGWFLTLESFAAKTISSKTHRRWSSDTRCKGAPKITAKNSGYDD